MPRNGQASQDWTIKVGNYATTAGVAGRDQDVPRRADGCGVSALADTGTRGSVTRAHTDALSSRGRGLGLIEQLSDSWGTDPTVRGSTVWFEMLIPATPPA